MSVFPFNVYVTDRSDLGYGGGEVVLGQPKRGQSAVLSSLTIL